MPNQNQEQIARDSTDKQLSAFWWIIRWKANSKFVMVRGNYQPRFAPDRNTETEYFEKVFEEKLV